MRGDFAFQYALGLTIKTTKNTKMTTLTSVKQLTLTDLGLIFGRAYYRKDICT